MNTDLVQYYNDRAAEYEQIYHRPERATDLAALAAVLQTAFNGKNVLEIACGTGYWTEKIAAVAASVTATDINQSVIAMAQQKVYVRNNVNCAIADLFKFQPARLHESLFAGFIWSHILLQNIPDFIRVVSKNVIAGGTVVMVDNNYVERSSTPIAHTDEQGNTYQLRNLENNTMHKVLKNFPDAAFVRRRLATTATDIQFINFHYYWMVMYKIIN